MWAHSLVAPRTFVRIEAPVPSECDLAPGEVLLRMVAGGICGSDLPGFVGQATTPALAAGLPGAPLHEVVGEVVAANGTSFAKGTLVVGWARDGNALCEFIVARADEILEYDAALAPHVALLIQPLACVLHAVRQLPVAGKTAAVIGQGPIGVLFSHVLKTSGASRVTAVDKVDRRDLAAELGVDVMVHGASDEWANQLADEQRSQIVIEAVGHQSATMVDAIEAVAHGGHIFAFGVPDDPIYPFPMVRFFRKSLVMRGGVTEQRTRALSIAADYLRAHPALANISTHRYDVDRVQEAFSAAADPRPGQLKIAIRMA